MPIFKFIKYLYIISIVFLKFFAMISVPWCVYLQDAEDGMAKFKSYLETRGRALSQTPEFASFYALPFAPEPETHASFTTVFSVTLTIQSDI